MFNLNIIIHFLLRKLILCILLFYVLAKMQISYNIIILYFCIYDMQKIQFPYHKPIETSLQFPFQDQDNPEIQKTTYNAL